VSDYPIINGAPVGYAQVSASIEVPDGESLATRDFASIDYSDSVEIVAQRGTGAVKVGDTWGVYDAQASISMYRDAFLRLQEALFAKSRSGALVEVSFDMIVSFADPLTGDTRTDVLQGCRLGSRELSMAPSADAVTVSFTPSVSLLLINGRRLA
jgi:hypothetical protein